MCSSDLVRSHLAVPVISRAGEVLGGLFFGHAESGQFDESDEQLTVSLASQAAISIDNEIGIAKSRAHDAQTEYERVRDSAGERKANIKAKIDALKA